MIEIGELVTYGNIFGTVVGTVSYDRVILDTLPNHKPISVNDLNIAPSSYFRKGAYVRIKRGLKHGQIYGGRLHFYDTSNSIKGTIHKVTKVSKNGTYYLNGIDGQTFALEMLEIPFRKGDLVALNEKGLKLYPPVLSNICTVEDICKDNCCLLYGISVEPQYLIEVATLPGVSRLKVNTNFIEKEDNYENQLQRKGSVIIRGQHPEGSRIYGRRPKAAVSIGFLSNKARPGYSKG